MKCYTPIIKKHKTEKNLNVHYHRLQRLNTISYSFNKTNNVNRFFIFSNMRSTCDIDWDKPFEFGDYRIDFTILKRHFQDDYFHLHFTYIQFRAIATKRNEYDFTKNTKIILLTKTVYAMKSTNKADKITLNFKTGLIKTQQNSRNRYRYFECFLHLFVVAAIWFRLDLWTLPTSLANAYPFCKYFTIYSLYYLVSFLVYLFDLWFAFVRFLKFKND